MQNFTFGRKGTNWFLFAFVLLIGTLPSFGQDCATVEDDDSDPNNGNQQSFCFLQTVEDIERTGTNTAIFETADTANDTQPIDSDELLTDDTTYFVGSTTEDCDRVAVEVTVTSADTPDNSLFSGQNNFTLSPCVSSEFTAEDLEDLFTADAGASYSIEAYTSEFGTETAEGELVPGESYFVGQVSSVEGECPSTRAAVGYNPTEAPTPIAEPAQTFCESATVADLVAEGTEDNTQAIRWYRSATSNSPLADNVQLINGEDYFASQIVNDRNDPFPPCETAAADRASVIVELVEGPDAGEQEGDGTVCESNVQETFPSNNAVENFYLGLLEDGVPTNGTFNPTIDQIVSQYQNDDDGLGDFTTTYTIGEGDCQDSVELTLSVVPAEVAEAGDDFSESYCIDQNEDFDLFSFLSDDAIETGEFSAPFEDGVFNPSEEGEGTYTITYSVNEGNSCVNGSDEATFTLEVNEVNEENITINIDPSEYEGMDENQILADLSSRFTPFFDGTPDFSAFDPDLQTAFAGLDPQNPEGTYEVTYTGNPCEILNFTVIIEEEEEPIVAEPGTGIVCETDVQEIFPSNDEVRKYYLALLPSGTPTNGTFNPTISKMVDNYQADEDGLGDFTTTYTVNNESFELTATIIPAIEANAGEGQTVNYCTGSGEQDLYDLLSEDADEDGVFEGYEDGIFDPSVEGQGTYEITYIVSDETACVTGSDSAVFNITVNEGDANAGDDAIGIVCETDVQETFSSVDEIRKFLLNLLDDDVSRNGTFAPTPSELADIYQNDEDGLGDFTTTYTVTDRECEDSAELTVRVTEAEEANAGDIADQEVCSNEGVIDLTDYLEGSGAVEGGTFTGEGVEDNMFDTSLGSNENGYIITYTVSEENGACVEGEDATTFTITVNDAPNAGPDVEESYCISEIEDMLQNPQDAIAWFTNLIDDEAIDQNGDFDPAIETLALQVIAYVENPTEPSATFETTYSVSNENCEDSATISLTINNIEEAEAGEFDDLTFCSTDDDQDLNNFLSEDATQGGTFSIDGEDLENGIFSTSMMEIATYTVTYSVDDSIECVEGEDSTTFVIELIEGADAGEDNSATICNQDILDGMFIGQEGLVKEFYLDLLDEGVSREGTFNPSLQEFIDEYDSGNQLGTFTTTYTVSEGACSDSVELSVTVVESVEAEVGEIEDQTLCSSDADIDLYDFITSGNEDGTFEGYENGTFSPSMIGAGSYEITYTVGEDIPCVEGEASTTFTIEVLQGANAGEDMDVTVCNNQPAQDLYSLISADADMDGEFTLDGEVITDGIMDPSAFEIGTYEVIYSVTAEDDECGGDDMSTITITLGEAPEAPTTGDAVAFCAIDGETAARLEADGTNLTWYSDADLTMMVSEEDLLVNGEYYVTQSADNGCESEAAMIMVNIVDSPAPTISSDYELCEFDNPTLADLTAEINETGEVTWYDSADSMTALSNNAMLTDGTTYYATLISDNGCESSERLAVTVTLEDCALLFPEAITPNGDGRNDRFVIENIEREYPNYNITIFNRWGNVVYKGNASTPTWDGISNQSGGLGDDVLPVGVYFYVVDFNDGSTSPRQGKVYLNR
jgi:gliding motility-associated-like protein